SEARASLSGLIGIARARSRGSCGLLRRFGGVASLLAHHHPEAFGLDDLDVLPEPENPTNEILRQVEPERHVAAAVGVAARLRLRLVPPMAPEVSRPVLREPQNDLLRLLALRGEEDPDAVREEDPRIVPARPRVSERPALARPDLLESRDVVDPDLADLVLLGGAQTLADAVEALVVEDDRVRLNPEAVSL